MLQKMRVILFFLVISLWVSGIASAQQAGGQFCIRAFEDRNGNGLHELDGSEPFLTRGVSAQLLDINNVVVATTLLDNSPTAINGVICFTGLEYTQYTVVVTSATYNATTVDSSTAVLNLGDPPTVFDFGGQPIGSTVNTTTAPAAAANVAPTQQEQIKWLVIAGLGSLVVIVVMIVFGVLIYLMAFHGRLRRSLPDSYFQRTSTGSYRVVQPRDTLSWATQPGATGTGTHRAAPTDTGSYPQQPPPPSYLDDTGPNPAITDSGEHPRTG